MVVSELVRGRVIQGEHVIRNVRIVVMATVLLVAGVATSAPVTAQEGGTTVEPALPIVFVHGGAGSAAQYRTQQMRFASNGYPNVVRAIDRPAGVDFNPLFDEFIDDILAETGDEQVYVLAHSLGTAIMNGYLNSSPERAARVDKYISLDGAPASCASLATECTNITAAGLGAHGHTQTVTSPESFVLQYEFLTGQSPATTEIVPEANPDISGRVINFPDNLGPGAGTLTMWEIDALTGHRTGTEPHATVEFTDVDDAGTAQDAGGWGPIAVDPDRHYEFELARAISDTATHYYMQPFLRSQDTIRLLTSPPDAATVVNTEVGDEHSAIVAIRYKEWWGNTSDGTNDSLRISTTSASGPGDPAFPREQIPAELINPATAPAPGTPGILNQKIGVHIHDVGSDGVTNENAAIPFFAGLVFQTGVDVFMPAADPVDGTIHMVSAHRGDADRPQVLNLANWRSSDHRIVVEFNDYVAAERPLPIVFVHGASGSAAQYQSQEQRFASNDYSNVVTGIDRISADHNVIAPILDDFFDDVMAETGDSQIYVVGHSQGVSVMNNYLNSASERAARVAKYIGIDSGSGVSPDVCPGNVACKGIWAQGDPARVLGPYNNVQFADQGHVQAVNSPESFVEQYTFFTGHDPTTSDVLPEDDVEISGKAVDFPANTGPGDATLEVWEVDGDTGHRTDDEPYATLVIAAGSDGSWGPLAVDPAQHYEFALQRAGADVTGHYYREPFVRSNHLIRLLVAPAFVSDNTDKSDDHSALVAIRYKEWWADHPTDPADSLLISTTSASKGAQAPVEVVNTATTPVSKGANGIHIFDAGIDGTTDLSAPIPFFFALPFQSGADVFMPAATPPDGTVTLRSVPRDATDRVQEINVANWASSTDRMAVEFNDYAPPPKPPEPRPMVFVHGGAGSGAQFETQALRFASNGYPANYMRVLEYNSANPAGFAAIPAQLDALIADIKAETGTDQVDLLGHSLGTGLMQAYLADPARAANVAHYVNIDGAQASAPPGGVRTLAIWGQGSPTRQIAGATNVRFLSQSHVEVATSRESFGEMYTFFNDGVTPATLDVLPATSADVEIAGRAVNFPANSGVTDASLEIYEVDPATGARLGGAEATFALEGDGAWGPFTGERGTSYELTIVRDPEDPLHHFYLQPLVRSDYLMRLNSSPPGEGIGALIERSDNHTALVITRYKEWWGNHPSRSDTLEIDGTNVLNAATSPVTKNAIGIFAFDLGSDGTSELSGPIPSLFGLPFITGMDLHIPASDPPDRTLSVVNAPRGDTSRLQTVNVPNWASSGHAVSIHFQDDVPGQRSDTFTARFTNEVCVTLVNVAALGFGSVEEMTRRGVDIFRGLVEAGELLPITNPPADEGPCVVTTTWPTDQLDGVTDTAAALGLTESQLHQAGARIIPAIIYWVAVHGRA